ncbi:sigma 54-interacting transcriptional regulator [Halobaculum sp. P14]|uniref:sigma 54-interacting transcriptional regulator n=1 Tax=Halobaculum sp. P14 TaxID=3421638 RepID=UPI003EBD30F5
MSSNVDSAREIAVGEARAQDVMDTVVLEGQVVKRSAVRPKVDVAVWCCQRCRRPQRPIQQGLGPLRKPAVSRCCDRKTANYYLDKEESDWVDWMKVRLQEPPEALSDGAAESVDLYLTRDLARKDIESGQRVRVTATFQPVSDRGQTVFKKAYVVDDLEPLDDDMVSSGDVDEALLGDLRRAADPVPALARAALPHHEGDEHLKEALVLQLVGGRDVDGENGKEYRGTMHIATIGDPGTGKSNFGDAIQRLSRRGAKASGNDGTSAAGLTAAITKDGFTDGTATITAGAVPKASGGALFVDELDSAGSSEQHALLEAMEDGQITIEKYGQQATLRADTAVFAAANPDDGHFHEDEPAIAQSSLYSPLLTRFDLIFCPRERTEEAEIDAVGGHVLDSWDAAAKQASGVDVDDSLLEDVEADVDEATLRAYLSEAQEYDPVFGDDAVKDALRLWYVETKLRLVEQEREVGRELPVTPRSLHDIVRLASASARARHSDTIEMRDAERATRLKTRMFRECGLDPGDEVIVEVDEDGQAVVSDESPTGAVLEAVADLKYEGEGYGANRGAVVESVAEETGTETADVEQLVEDMVATGTLDVVSEGRVTA